MRMGPYTFTWVHAQELYALGLLALLPSLPEPARNTLRAPCSVMPCTVLPYTPGFAYTGGSVTGSKLCLAFAPSVYILTLTFPHTSR